MLTFAALTDWELIDFALQLNRPTELEKELAIRFERLLVGIDDLRVKVTPPSRDRRSELLESSSVLREQATELERIAKSI